MMSVSRSEVVLGATGKLTAPTPRNPPKVARTRSGGKKLPNVGPLPSFYAATFGHFKTFESCAIVSAIRHFEAYFEANPRHSLTDFPFDYPLAMKPVASGCS